jgi:hypothetical protein
VTEAAERESLSLSSWARRHLASAAASKTWPAAYTSLLGSIPDLSFTAPEALDPSGDLVDDLP